MARYGLIIDVSRCNGCGSCLLAVKDEYTGNAYPGYSAPMQKGDNWLNLVEVEQGEGSKVKMDYIPVMYCHKRDLKLPEGVPEGAMYVREDGLTIIDPVKAKGCRQILELCDDGTIFWNEELDIPQIYTLDAHRLDEGERLPRCVESCPTQAMRWGDLDDPESDVSKFIAAHPDEIEGDEDCVVRYYKLPKPFIAGEVLLGDRPDKCCEGARVRLLRDGSEVASTTTDFFGDFEFKYLEKDAEYTVDASFDGYKSVRLKVTADTAKNLGTIILEK